MTYCKNCKYTDEYCASGDCNEIQANDLACNKISLTEQWKKGELPEGFYYIKCDWSDEVEIRYVHNGVDDWKEIVAEVPDYVEWRNMVNCACEEHEANKRLIEENAQLKELLKECKTPLEVYNEMFGNKEELLTKIDEVLK